MIDNPKETLVLVKLMIADLCSKVKTNMSDREFDSIAEYISSNRDTYTIEDLHLIFNRLEFNPTKPFSYSGMTQQDIIAEIDAYGVKRDAELLDHINTKDDKEELVRANMDMYDKILNTIDKIASDKKKDKQATVLDKQPLEKLIENSIHYIARLGKHKNPKKIMEQFNISEELTTKLIDSILEHSILDEIGDYKPLYDDLYCQFNAKKPGRFARVCYQILDYWDEDSTEEPTKDKS